MKKAILLLVAVLGMFLLCILIKGWLFKATSDSSYYPTVWALIWTGVAFWLAEQLSNGGVGQFPVYILSGAIGGAAGWLIGIYFFPKNSDEVTRFQTIGSVMGTFLSGYLLKEFGDVWKYLTTPAATGALPPILLPPRREYAAFFLASLLISGGVQYGTRTLETVLVGWNGPIPQTVTDDKVPRSLLTPGKRYQLAGAVDSGDNPAVRWSLESPTDPDTLKEAEEHGIATLDPNTGILTVQPKAKWSWSETDAQGKPTTGSITKPFYAEIIASGVARPDLAKAIEVKFDPTALDSTSPGATPAPANSTSQAGSPSGTPQ
jgi:hypothetical protein